jgi:hypothetical protein
MFTLGAWLGLSAIGHSQQTPPAPKAKAGEEKSTHYPMPLLPNPGLAQSVTQALKQSGQLARCKLQVYAHGGIVDLVGELGDESQRSIAIHVARMAPGLVMVRDWMQVRQESSIVRTQAPLIQPLPIPPAGDKDKGPTLPPRIDGQLPEPMPIFQPMPGPNPQMQPPPMPPYAWPTFAPYNNYSRVAYPTAYPYEQWPFIGPMYPFPRVPLGWRSVTLTWEDGHWWYHRNPTGHDWWRIRYH